MLAQTERASGIVNNLLNFSRTSGADFAPLDLNRVLDDTLQLLEIQLHKSSITIARTFSEGLPEAFGNAGKLQQVAVSNEGRLVGSYSNGRTLDLDAAAAKYKIEEPASRPNAGSTVRARSL